MIVELLPTRRATNSYELLDDVIRAIEEEPKRFNWRDWIILDAKAAVDFQREAPACNTMACVAGWIVIQSMSDQGRQHMAEIGWSAGIAGKAIGQFPQRTEIAIRLQTLFYGDGESILKKVDSCGKVETQEEYAARAVRAIRRFQADFKDELLAHPIQVIR